MWATILKENGQYIGGCGIYPHFNNDGNTVPDEGILAFYIADLIGIRDSQQKLAKFLLNLDLKS